MPQQVNLCLPLLRKQKDRFSAHTLAQGTAALLLLGGILGGVWVWQLNLASASLRDTLAAQTKDLTTLRTAVASTQANAGPNQHNPNQSLTQRQTQLKQRQKILDTLQQGLVRPGWGHSARLQTVAQSIPSAVWVTRLKATDRQLDVAGFTLEPAALNDWRARLGQSPLFQGQALSTVTVDSVRLDASAVATTAKPPMWSYTLQSNLAAPVAKGSTGGQP